VIAIFAVLFEQATEATKLQQPLGGVAVNSKDASRPAEMAGTVDTGRNKFQLSPRVSV